MNPINILTEKDKLYAIAFSNSLRKMTESCPREVINPGLYFGFIEGLKYIKKQYAENNFVLRDPSRKKFFIISDIGDD